jgi:hypothetical protein
MSFALDVGLARDTLVVGDMRVRVAVSHAVTNRTA